MANLIELQAQALELAGGDPTQAAELLQQAADHATQLSAALEAPLPSPLDMIDWSGDRAVIGYWLHIGRTKLDIMPDMYGEYVPFNMRDDIKSISKGDDGYWRFFAPKTKKKLLYSRQLLQDFRGNPLVGFDVHHLRGPDENCLESLQIKPARAHRAEHGREGGHTNAGRGRGPGGSKRKRCW